MNTDEILKSLCEHVVKVVLKGKTPASTFRGIAKSGDKLTADEMMEVLHEMLRFVEQFAALKGSEKKDIVLRALRMILYQFNVDDAVTNFVYYVADPVIDMIIEAWKNSNYLSSPSKWKKFKARSKRLLTCN